MEPNLSFRETRLLRKTRFATVLTEFGESDRNRFETLADLGLVDIKLDFVLITERGRAYLQARFKSVFGKIVIGVVLALVSAFIPLLLPLL